MTGPLLTTATLVNLIILFIVDDFTRFMQGHAIPNKEPETVIRKLLDEWILKMFGCPESIRVDNGGEFMNQAFKEMTEKLGIKLISTGANSPFHMGLHDFHCISVEEDPWDGRKCHCKSVFIGRNEIEVR